MSLTKPECKIVKADWAWNPDPDNEQIKRSTQPVLSKRQLRKKKIDDKKRLARKCHAAARQARNHLNCSATGLGFRDYANALAEKGVLPAGEYTKDRAMAALSTWYDSIPSKDRVKNKAAYNPKAFYDSKEWRKLRYEVLTTQGRQCQCCGASPPKVVLHVDHIKPRSKYPELELDIDNLQILCEACNLGKSNLDDTDFRGG